MFSLFFRPKGKDGDPTRVDLPEESKMYYDEEKKRWREHGKEHLEPQEEKLAPPPKDADRKPEPASLPVDDAAKTGLGALMTPPSYRMLDKADSRTDCQAAGHAAGGGAAKLVTANQAGGNTQPFNSNASVSWRNRHASKSVDSGVPAPCERPLALARCPQSYAPVPLMSSTKNLDPKSMTDNAPVLNKPQPAFPNQDMNVAPVCEECHAVHEIPIAEPDGLSLQKAEEAPSLEDEAENSGMDGGVVEAKLGLQQQGPIVASKVSELGLSNGDSGTSWILLPGDDARRSNAGHPPSIIESVPAPEKEAPEKEAAEVKDDTKADVASVPEEDVLGAWMAEDGSTLREAEVNEESQTSDASTADAEEPPKAADEQKEEATPGVASATEDVAPDVWVAEVKDEHEEAEAKVALKEEEDVNARMAEVSGGLKLSEVREEYKEGKAHGVSAREDEGLEGWTAEVSSGPSMPEGSGRPTTPEEQPKSDGAAAAREEPLAAPTAKVEEPAKSEVKHEDETEIVPETAAEAAGSWKAEVNSGTREVEATHDVAPVQESPEDTTADIAPVQDFAAEGERTKWMAEVSEPKAHEPEVSSTNGEPPLVPVTRSMACGLAVLERSLADGGTRDDAAKTNKVGTNVANLVFASPKLNIEERDMPTVCVAESLAATNADPLRSEAQKQLHTVEARLATLCAHAADLELQLREAKRKACEREEQLLAVQKAQEERLQLAEAEAAERRDQFQAQEERLHKVEVEAAEMRAQLQAERSKSVVAGEAAGKAAASTATASLSEDDFGLPNLVQSCGKTEVIEFARRLASDTAALRTQQQLQSQQAQQQVVSISAAEAIAAGVAEGDGHQIAPLLALLQEKHGDLQISMKICSALETLTLNTSEHRVKVVKWGGLEALVGLLDEHKDAGVLLRPVVDTLWNLTFDEEAVDAATKVGAIERIAALMQKHRGEAVLIAGACAVLLNLAVREENRWKIVESGSVGLMASAMQQHSENEELMQLGSQALYMLAYRHEFRPIVLAARGGEAAALAAACPQGTTGTVQMWGRWLQEVLAC